jgi:hypothetical protein
MIQKVEKLLTEEGILSSPNPIPRRAVADAVKEF